MTRKGYYPCLRCGEIVKMSDVLFTNDATQRGSYWKKIGKRYAAFQFLDDSAAPDAPRVKKTASRYGWDYSLTLSDGTTASIRVCPQCRKVISSATHIGMTDTALILLTGLPGSGKTAFCKFIESTTASAELQRWGYRIQGGGGGASTVRLVTTQIGNISVHEFHCQDRTVALIDTAGELIKADGAEGELPAEAQKLLANLGSLGDALDGVITIYDQRSLTQNIVKRPDAVTYQDLGSELIFNLNHSGRHERHRMVMAIYNKSDLLRGSLNADAAPYITRSSPLFTTVSAGRSERAKHMALAEQFIMSATRGGLLGTPPTASFVVSLGQPMPNPMGTLNFDVSRQVNAVLPLTYLLEAVGCKRREML